MKKRGFCPTCGVFRINRLWLHRRKHTWELGSQLPDGQHKDHWMYEADKKRYEQINQPKKL